MTSKTPTTPIDVSTHEAALVLALHNLADLQKQVDAIQEEAERKAAAAREKVLKPHADLIEQYKQAQASVAFIEDELKGKVYAGWLEQGRPDKGYAKGAVELRVTYRGETVEIDEAAALKWALANAKMFTVTTLNKGPFIKALRDDLITDPAALATVQLRNSAVVALKRSALPTIEELKKVLGDPVAE